MSTVGVSISGGSSKGAFAVGALQKLSRRFPAMTFDMVSGTSTGALVAPFVVLDDYNAAARLYGRFSSADLIIEHAPGDVLRTGHLLNMDGLIALMRKVFDDAFVNQVRASPKRMFITTVQMQSGAIVYFYTGSNVVVPDHLNMVEITNRDMFIDAIAASAMQPVIMPLVEIDGGQYCDGGVRETAPIQVLIEQGVENLLAIVLSAPNEHQSTDKFKDFLDTLKRTVSLLLHEGTQNDIEIAQLYHDTAVYLADVRATLKQSFTDPGDAAKIDNAFDTLSVPNPLAGTNVINLELIRPATKLLDDPLRFSRDDMRKMIRRGRDTINRLFPPGGRVPFEP